MIDIINNKSKLLGDDLKEEIKSGSRLRIAASCFSIYAYAALKEELEKIEELEFLFTTPTFLSEQVSDNIKKEKREFYIPKFSESGICGTDFEIRLKNQMTQKAIARECADWIRNKVKVKTLKESVTTQSMINISSQGSYVHYTPVDGFTTADLGYERNDSKLIGIMKTDIPEQSKFFPSRLEKYEEKYQIDLQSEDKNANSLGQGLTRQMNRENGIKKLMTISLLKRLESSVYSFRLTLESLLETNQTTLRLINSFLAGNKSAGIDKELFNYAAVDPDDDDSFALTKISSGKKIHIDLADLDVVSWKRDIEQDIEILTSIYVEMKKVTPEEDKKLNELFSLIDDKITNPINPPQAPRDDFCSIVFVFALKYWSNPIVITPLCFLLRNAFNTATE